MLSSRSQQIPMYSRKKNMSLIKMNAGDGPSFFLLKSSSFKKKLLLVQSLYLLDAFIYDSQNAYSSSSPLRILILQISDHVA